MHYIYSDEDITCCEF